MYDFFYRFLHSLYVRFETRNGHDVYPSSVDSRIVRDSIPRGKYVHCAYVRDIVGREGGDEERIGRERNFHVLYICFSTGGEYNRWNYANGYVNSPAWHVPLRVAQIRNVMVHATPRTLTNRFIPAYPRWDGTKKEVPRYISERIGPLLLNTLCERKERETERTWREKKRDERERRRLPRSSIHDASFAFTRPRHVHTFTILSCRYVIV